MTHQRDQALAKAQWVRSKKRELRELIKAQEVDPVALLRGDDRRWEPFIRGMRLDKALALIHGIGEVTTEEILDKMRIGASVKLEGMTFERRAELARYVHMALYGEIPIEIPKEVA